MLLTISKLGMTIFWRRHQRGHGPAVRRELQLVACATPWQQWLPGRGRLRRIRKKKRLAGPTRVAAPARVPKTGNRIAWRRVGSGLRPRVQMHKLPSERCAFSHKRTRKPLPTRARVEGCDFFLHTHGGVRRFDLGTRENSDQADGSSWVLRDI